MDLRTTIEIIAAVLGAAFAAGGFYWQAQNTRKQVNGVGRKLQLIEKYLAETAEGEQRKRLTDIMKG